ncbi:MULTISPECIES: replication initiator protein A [unclassified Paenibacillus]|uniref:Replication initiator protein A n=1 Tax=Paenibacillus provencensis TaxID=441151 RepID=A0ABW3Q0X8_9BACL|nr:MULTISPECIES: replication initiator protein A [unclassified Paenibacillus]MCM3130620.1 replication initiator protein A [Paenibacillus sp. MER 78]SDX74311.1 Replication initiator protein A [Paenibacillus sp. PDC88]SFS89729.1 Replication initiator protein A [Paenibacillus sp. 453mf]
MPRRKVNIDQWVSKIVVLELPKEDPKVQDLIIKAADQLKSKSKEEAQRHIRDEGQKELELTKLLLQQTNTQEEADAINKEIFKHQIKQIIWNKSQEIRRATYYNKPSHPYGHIFAEGAISSISTKRQKALSAAEDGDTLVRDNRRTRIYHPANKELTLQDAKVLIGIHKLWEESGKQKEFEFTIYSLAKAMNRDTGGKTYNEIWQSLEVLQDSKFEFCYYYEKGIIDSLDRINILQAIGRKDRHSTFKIMFSDMIYRSLQSGAIAYLSLAILEDLKTDTAQNLYLFLPAQVGQGITRWPLEEISNLMGSKATRPVYKKKAVEDACKNMVEISLLEEFTIHEDETGTSYLEVTPTNLLLNSTSMANQAGVQQLSLPI